jgi:mRNA interferase HigB
LLNVISKRNLFEKAAKHSDALSAVQVWFDIAEQAEWYGLEDIRRIYPNTDMVGPLAIFNIKGNRYGLIVRMAFHNQRIYVKEFLTHAEYSKGGWKKWLS